MSLRALVLTSLIAALSAVRVSSGAHTPSAASLQVVSLNLAMDPDAARISREVLASAGLRHADVFLLQEVVQPENGGPDVARALAELWGMHHRYEPAFPLPGRNRLGIAILSRYPLRDIEILPLKSFELHFRSRRRIAMGATLDTPRGPVRVYNVHLDTRINASDRLEQLAPVLRAAGRFSGPKLIGGDFNTNHIRWIGHVLPIPFTHRQDRALAAALAADGYSTPFRQSGATFDFFGFRLDWVFASGMSSRASGVEPLRFSDHHAIWTVLEVGGETLTGEPRGPCGSVGLRRNVPLAGAPASGLRLGAAGMN